MGERTAILIVNYNMPERADALAEAIAARVKVQHSTIVIDNGSTIQPAKNTTIRIRPNIQTTGGWLEGLRHIRGMGFTSYWFMITSAEFPQEDYDPLAPMLELLRAGAVGVHPALTTDSTTSWEHLKDRGTGKPRRTWMIDNIASLYDAAWFDAHPFDPALLYAWGIDLETCWHARKERRALYVDERTKIKKVTNIGYTMDRMGMSARDREERAGANMSAVLSARYGANWWQRMNNEFVTEDMR